MATRWLFGAACSVASLALCACEFQEAGKACASGPGLTADAFDGSSLASQQLALSFDGGPGGATAAIGTYLASQGVAGAFFVRGNQVEANDTVLATLKGEGHVVGNGGDSNAPLASNADPVAVVRHTDELILPGVSGDIFLLRAEGGLSEADAAKLNDAGLTRYVGEIGFDVGVGTAGLTDDRSCWLNGVTPPSCAAGYLTAIQAAGKGIVQLHSDDAQTVTLLQTLVPELKGSGYTLVRLDAVPSISIALQQSGAAPGTVGGAGGCSEY